MSARPEALMRAARAGAFEPAGYFSLRAPVLPLTDLARWADDARDAADPRAALRDGLRAAFARPELREALRVAAPALDSRVDAWLRGEPDGVRDGAVERALVRCFVRMASRATPSGLLAGCAAGRIGDETRLALAARGTFRRRTRLAADYVAALADALGVALEQTARDAEDDGEPLATLIATLERAALAHPATTGRDPRAAAAAVLRGVQAQLAASDFAPCFGSRRAHIEQVCGALGALPVAPDPARTLRVEMRLAATAAVLDRRVVAELVDAARILAECAPSRDEAAAREDATAHDGVQPGSLEAMMLARLEALARGQRTLELSRTDFALLPHREARLPGAFVLVASCAAESADALARGDCRVALRAVEAASDANGLARDGRVDPALGAQTRALPASDVPPPRVRWSWGALARRAFLPRVVLGRVVLTPARWTLTARQLAPLGDAPDPTARMDAARALRAELALPRFVEVADGDDGDALLVDFDNALSVDAFAELVADRADVVLTELFPAPGHACVGSPDGAVAHELRIPVVRRPAVALELSGASERHAAGGSTVTPTSASST